MKMVRGPTGTAVLLSSLLFFVWTVFLALFFGTTTCSVATSTAASLLSAFGRDADADTVVDADAEVTPFRFVMVVFITGYNN